VVDVPAQASWPAGEPRGRFPCPDPGLSPGSSVCRSDEERREGPLQPDSTEVVRWLLQIVPWRYLCRRSNIRVIEALHFLKREFNVIQLTLSCLPQLKRRVQINTYI